MPHKDEPTKKKKKRYADILRMRYPQRRLGKGYQEVPMDIGKINAAFAAANPS